MSKFVSNETDPPATRRQRAINKWLATERENEATNTRLMTVDMDYQVLPDVTFAEFVLFAQRLIENTIGAIPDHDYLIGGHSSGASTSRNRTISQAARKYVGKADVTTRAYHRFFNLIVEMPGWDFPISDINLFESNVLFTVPKKADIDRVACKEPDINMFMQRGVGRALRNHLLSVGVNLNDQTINQRLARFGSTHDGLSTIDLSSASDSISEGLVCLLLPIHWFGLLDDLRCHETLIDGELHRNHMFSSMGNGFTFELESLLFWALAKTVLHFRGGASGIISVYGDDIICPQHMTHDLIIALSFFGFTTNEEKSFISGPFRESCGGHYHYGRDVTPFYLRKPITHVTDVIHVANSLRKWASCEVYKIADPELEEIWFWLRDYVPVELWGGRDFGSKSALVSPDIPNKRLVEACTEICAEIGGYYHWLNTTWDRDYDFDNSCNTSTLSSSLSFFRTRKNREMVSALEFVFPREI